jgi:F420-dependent oxidoreductase-like protein
VSRLALFNSAAGSLSGAVERTRLAERLGFESVWITQLPPARDQTLVLAAYAAASERIGLGTGVLPIYTRHPTAMAQMALTLDEISGGRLVLGIGISHRVTVESMWGLRLEKPVDAMREYLTIVGQLVREGATNLEGRHFTAHAAYSGPRRESMPIMISALNPLMLELAGELSDGVVLWMCSSDYIRDHVIPAVTAGRERAGLSLEGFEVVAAVPVSLTADPAAGRDAFRATVERYASLPFYRSMLDRSGFKEELDRGQVADPMVDQLAGIGGPEEVQAAIRRFREAGATLPVVGPFAGYEGAAELEPTLQAALGG